MINEFLKRLTPNFSNIDEVYSELLTTYNPDNINTTELTFINSVQYENVEHSENVQKLSMYLGKKSTTIDWHNIDYYNHYINTGRFGFSLLHTYNSKNKIQNKIAGKTIEYQEFIGTLNTYKNRYDYIVGKLNKDAKKEFKFDFCDQLETLKSKQTETKFKEAINDFINSINEAPQQIITKNTDEVNNKKIPEKWHALLHWIELTANGQRPPINNEGGFIKSEIEKIGIEKTGTTGQSFYRKFIEIDLNNSKELIGMFGNDWKQKIIQLSNNNQKVIDYIELKYKL